MGNKCETNEYHNNPTRVINEEIIEIKDLESVIVDNNNIGSDYINKEFNDGDDDNNNNKS